MRTQSSPPTRYRGSKRKLLPWLAECLGSTAPTTVLDLMAGTSSVAYYFKKTGAQVVSNDYLAYNHLTAIALIENNNVTLTEADIQSVAQVGLSTIDGFIHSTFDGLYFSSDENRWLDAALSQIEATANEYPDLAVRRYKRALMIYALGQACLMKRPFNLFHRKNLALREANVERRFGNKTTWETPFSDLFRRIAGEVNTFIFDNSRRNRATSFLAEVYPQDEHFDLVYIDPPYYQRANDTRVKSYRHLYHFLEGISNVDDWRRNVDYGHPLRILRDNGPEILGETDPQSDFSVTMTEWLRLICERWPSSTIALSYKSPGVPDKSQIIAMLTSLRRSVQVFSKEYQYALWRKPLSGEPTKELLFLSEPSL